MKYEKVNAEDVNVMKGFIDHFKLPTSTSLSKAIKAFEADQSLENKTTVSKEFIKYLAEHPEASLSKLLGANDAFDKLDKTIAEVNKEINGDG